MLAGRGKSRRRHDAHRGRTASGRTRLSDVAGSGPRGPGARCRRSSVGRRLSRVNERNPLTTALVGSFLAPDVPEGHMLRSWPDSWSGIGQVLGAMTACGYHAANYLSVRQIYLYDNPLLAQGGF